jgi:hypothetical protein
MLIASVFIKHKPLALTDLVEEFVYNFFFNYTWFIYNLFIGFVIILVAYSYPKLKLLIYALSFLTVIFWASSPYLSVLSNVGHTFTLFGFSFYLLMGFYLGYNIAVFNTIITTILKHKTVYIIILIIISGIACYESLYLYNYTNISPTFNLKLFSQIQSILIFFGFCTISQKQLYPDLVDPRTETVGIYFMHTLVLNFVFIGSFIILIFGFNINGKEEIPVFYLTLSLFLSPVFVYALTLFIVKKIAKTKLSYLIGI